MDDSDSLIMDDKEICCSERFKKTIINSFVPTIAIHKQVGDRGSSVHRLTLLTKPRKRRSWTFLL